MKLIKHIALGTIVVLSVLFAISNTTSCSKDACKGVTCLNGANCSGGLCGPCDSGIGGTNCQIVYRQLYGALDGSGQTYLGNAVIDYSHLDSLALDSGYINHTDDSNTLVFSFGHDSTFALMQLVWKDQGIQMLSTNITISNNSSTGSTFAIPATQGGPGDSFMVSGSGNVNSTNASVSLTAVPVHTTTPTIYITLSNCTKQ